MYYSTLWFAFVLFWVVLAFFDSYISCGDDFK